MYTEAELCEEIKREALANNARVFSEFNTWDLVLVFRDIIIGVQAKLQLNVKVIAQCLQSDDVHFKIICLLNEPRLDKDDDLLTIADRLKLAIFVFSEKNNCFYIFGKKRNIFYFRQKPNKLLRVPDFSYNLPAGIRAPKKMSEKAIAYCRLEKIVREKGCFTFLDAQKLGLEKIPNLFFRYDLSRRCWILREHYFPSKLYPHIWKNIE